jgi:hypothetical protein
MFLEVLYEVTYRKNGHSSGESDRERMKGLGAQCLESEENMENMFEICKMSSREVCVGEKGGSTGK